MDWNGDGRHDFSDDMLYNLRLNPGGGGGGGGGSNEPGCGTLIVVILIFWVVAEIVGAACS